MPFYAIERPALGLGILKAILKENGHFCSITYANIEFASKIGVRENYYISNLHSKNLIGEWVFSSSIFPTNEQNDSDFLFECFYRGIPAKILLGVREKIPLFLDELTDRLLAETPQIIGCSSTFQQHCASLALLKRVKEKNSDTITMMGGANCDGPMGIATHLNFDWIDFVVSGEADESLPLLCELITQYGTFIPQNKLPPGVIGRTNNLLPLERIGRPQISNIDNLPLPDYSEYLPAVKMAGLDDTIKPGMIIEASRGCWWGQHNQCVFCGINPLSITSRIKNSDKVIEEIEKLISTYGITRIEFSDYILPMHFFTTLIPYLSERKEKLHLLFETSACLTESQIRQLSEAGITWIQPGIESLDDDLLRLLNKASSVYQNIQLLKASQKYGVFVLWNFLANIPGDTEASYEKVIDLLPLLYHLQPPCAFGQLRYDRFSPIFQMNLKLNIQLQPNWPYHYIYPTLSTHALNDIAYFFQKDSKHDSQPSESKTQIFARIESIIEDWKDAFFISRDDIVMKEISADRPRLCMQLLNDEIIIEDTRPCAVDNKYILTGPLSEIYMASTNAPTIHQLYQKLKKSKRFNQSQNEVEQSIEYLIQLKLLIRLQDRLLGLAVEKTDNPYPNHDNYPGGLVRIPRKQKL